MKLNSSTVILSSEDRKAVEEIIQKIAAANDIEDVESVKLVLSSESGEVSFKTACPMEDAMKAKKKTEEEEEGK